MFPLLGWGEIPNRVNVLLDGTKYLHIQFNDCLYQFEDPHRENILRNIRHGIAPLITGAIWPGAVCLLNTTTELNEFYARVAKESEESDSPNTKFGQKFIAWLNRYMADTDHRTRAKPLKNSMMSHAFKHWHPPAWAERGNGHTEGEQPSEATSQPPPPAPEAAPPSTASSSLPPATEVAQPATSSSLPRAPEVARPPAALLSSALAPAKARTRSFGVMSSSQQSLPTTVPLLILMWRNRTTHRHDGLPKGAPGWGDEIVEWCDFIHQLSCAGCTKKFAGVHKKTDPKHQEPPTDRRLRGFILEGYFAPRFQYDSNCNGWRHSFARLFVVLGWYRAIIEREGWIIVPGCTSPWSESTNKVLSPFVVAGHLAQNGFSFQEADDLHEWAVAALQDDIAG